MRKTKHAVLLLMLWCVAGCEKPPTGGQDGKSTALPVSGDGFAKEYEEWKARAVKEFPDLGKAGTAMNTRFLEAAKELSDRNGEELKYPNWPYLLAVKVNGGLAAAPKPVPAAPARPAAPVPAPPSAYEEAGRVYTIPELKALAALPSAAVVTGRVTRFDEIGLPPGVLSVVLDDALKCELTMYEHASADGLSWQRNGSTISLVRQVGRGANATVVSVSMGQVLRVEGVFAQRRGSSVLIGTARRD